MSFGFFPEKLLKSNTRCGMVVGRNNVEYVSDIYLRRIKYYFDDRDVAIFSLLPHRLGSRRVQRTTRVFTAKRLKKLKRSYYWTTPLDNSVRKHYTKTGGFKRGNNNSRSNKLIKIYNKSNKFQIKRSTLLATARFGWFPFNCFSRRLSVYSLANTSYHTRVELSFEKCI